MKLSIPNLIISIGSIILGMYLIKIEGSQSLVSVLSLSFGVLLMSLNQPLQYNDKKQVKLLLIILAIAIFSFLYCLKVALDYQRDLQIFWSSVLVGAYVIYAFILIGTLVKKD